MHKTIEEVSRVRRMMETLMQWQENEVAKGQECFDCEAAGKTIDMIKDLAEASAEMLKAKYYEMLICDMMLSDEDLHEAGRMGYDNWKYPSSGRYAPKGHGRYVGHTGRSGYIPYPYDMDPDRMENDGWEDMLPKHMRPMMGYDRIDRRDGNMDNRDPNRMRSNDRMGFPMNNVQRDMMEEDPYGGSYHEYKMARRHYTESHDMKDARHMNQKIQEATMAAGESLHEMWKDANPETREKMKTDVSNMLKEWEHGK